MVPADEALKRLREGNRRFVSGTGGRSALPDPSGRSELVERQDPFAIVLSCSDSRVPPEVVFDQGLGDLFVVRVAGNIADATQIGSVEFAAVQFQTRLVLVLGHSRCGAVLATLEDLQGSKEERSPNLRSIIEFVRPSVAPLLEADVAHDREALIRRAVRANVEASVERLRSSEVLARLIEKSGLAVLGAEYSLETGRVTFFDRREPDGAR